MKLAPVDAAERGAIVPGMTDEISPPKSLPEDVTAREVRLLWLEEGFEPLPSNKDGELCDNLADAISRARKGYADARGHKKLPWVRAGTGEGSAVLNIQGILLLNAAFNEGSKK